MQLLKNKGAIYFFAFLLTISTFSNGASQTLKELVKALPSYSYSFYDENAAERIFRIPLNQPSSKVNIPITLPSQDGEDSTDIELPPTLFDEDDYMVTQRSEQKITVSWLEDTYTTFVRLPQKGNKAIIAVITTVCEPLWASSITFFDGKGKELKNTLGLPPLNASLLLPNNLTVTERNILQKLPIALDFDESNQSLVVTLSNHSELSLEEAETIKGFLSTPRVAQFPWKNGKFSTPTN